ncbi:Zinc finger protein 136 [Plakobranchus ocellatus]|uniref:Zinc finger protein 136 n=1 Tax=Plakobranchus ocellatus TaxID=259542 RepID=A0AAV4ANI8_9GAST|nr:Zinc finger protein 136 [Plakobranchus ocellatus]
MEEDTSRAISGGEINYIPSKGNIVPSRETNGISNTVSADNDKTEEKNVAAKLYTPSEPGVKTGVLQEAPNLQGKRNSSTPLSSGQSGQNPVMSGEFKASSRHPGANNNNNNNVDKSKPKTSVPSIISGPGQATLVSVDNNQARIQALAPESTASSVFTHSVPSATPSLAHSAASSMASDPAPALGTTKLSEHQLQAYQTDRSKLEKLGGMDKLVSAGGQISYTGHRQDSMASQRISPSSFQRTAVSQRLSPAQVQQMSTSDMIHSASTLIHGSDIQGSNSMERPTHPSVSHGTMSSPLQNRGGNDSRKKVNSPGYMKCQDLTSTQLKNYLLSPGQTRSPNPTSVASDALLAKNYPVPTSLTEDSRAQQNVKSLSKSNQPNQKAPRKRKSKAAANKQASKASSFLGDDDDDNDFIPVGMVQMTSRRPGEINPEGLTPQPSLQQQLEKQVEQQKHSSLSSNHMQQQYQQTPEPSAKLPGQHQRPPGSEERKDFESRSQQHQLLLQLVQQVQQAQQQKQIMEYQQRQKQLKQQNQPQLEQPQSAAGRNPDVKLEGFSKNQGLIIHHFQKQTSPGVSEKQKIPTDTSVQGAAQRLSDQMSVYNLHQASSVPSAVVSLPSSSTSPRPHNSQTQASATIVSQSKNLQYSNIPKIAEQLLQQPSSDQETHSAAEADDQVTSKVELYLLHSKTDASQPAAHSLQTTSPTWQSARSITPTAMSGHHSHHHPEISRMLCSPVSPRQSASSPRASVSPRRTESPFQPSLSPSHFVSPRQPVSPHSRMVSSMTAATSSSSKNSASGQGAVRNSPSQASSLKMTLTRQNSSPRPPSSPWQPISPSQVAITNPTTFPAVQKPHPTVGHIDGLANQGHELSSEFGTVISSQLTASNAQLNLSSHAQKPEDGFPPQSRLGLQQVQQRNLSQAPAFNVATSLQYSQAAPSSPLCEEGDAPAPTVNPGQVIHHLPVEQQSSGGSSSSQHYVPVSSILPSSMKVPMPSAQNASPIWQQMQHQQHQHQESITVNHNPQDADRSKPVNFIPSKPVDIQRLAQQHQQSELSALQQPSYRDYRDTQIGYPMGSVGLQNAPTQGLMKDSQIGQLPITSAQAQSQLSPLNTGSGLVPADASRGPEGINEKETRLTESLLLTDKTSASDHNTVNENERDATQQIMESHPATDSKTGLQNARKNDGALQVLSEIASERYALAVAEVETGNPNLIETSESKSNGKGNNEVEKKSVDSATVNEATSVKPKEVLSEIKAESQTSASANKVEVSNETPRREVRQRKPKKPFEQDETPSRRNARSATNQRLSTDATSLKKSAPGSHKKVQGRKSAGTSSKSDGEQESKPVAAKASLSNRTDLRIKKGNKSDDDDDYSESDHDSEAESVEPRRLSRRLQVKKQERLKQKNDNASGDEESSNQRRSQRIATRVDYKEEHSDTVDETNHQHGTRSSRLQQREPSADSVDVKTAPFKPETVERIEKVSTRSRNSRKDNSKDVSAAQAATSKTDADSHKLPEAVNSEKKGPQGVSGSKAIAVAKPEPPVSLERKMRTRNRSKSRSRSPTVAGLHDGNTPLTRRNMAVRQAAVVTPKSSGKDASNAKRPASTEFIDGLPPWRKYPKKEDSPTNHTEQLPEEKPKQEMQSEDKGKILSGQKTKQPVEVNKSHKGKRGRKPRTSSKTADLDKSKEHNDNESEMDSSQSVLKSEAKAKSAIQNTASPATAATEETSLEGKALSADKKSAAQNEKPDVKLHGAGLLEKTFAETDEKVPKLDTNRIPGTTFEALGKITHGRSDTSVKQPELVGSEPSLARNLNLSGHNSKKLEKVKEGLVPLSGDVGHVESLQAHKQQQQQQLQQQQQPPKMVVYKLVPVAEEEMSSLQASSLVPVNGYIVAGAGANRIILPENCMQGPTTSPAITTAILKSTVPAPLQHSSQHRPPHQLAKPSPQSAPSAILSAPPSDPKQSLSSSRQHYYQAPPVSPLRTALCSPLNPPHSSASSSPAAWAAPHHPQQSPSPSLQGQWGSAQRGHHPRGTPTASPKHAMVTATPPPAQSPHYSSSPAQQHQPLPPSQQQQQQQQQYQQHQASPGPPYGQSPTWNPTPPSMPPSSPQLPSSSSSSSSIWNMSSSHNPQNQHHQQVSLSAHQHHPQHHIAQAQHQQHQLPLPPQQHQQLHIPQHQQAWIPQSQKALETQAWRSSGAVNNSTVTAAVESWSKEFLPSPPLYNSSTPLVQQQQQQRRRGPMDVGHTPRSEQISHIPQQPTMYSEIPSQLQAQQQSAMYGLPASQQQQPPNSQQQQEASEFSDARADQIIQNFLKSAAGGGGGGGGVFGPDLTGFNLGQQDMAYLESRLRLSPNSLVSAVAAAYEEDVGASNVDDCGVGDRGRGGQHQDSVSMQDTINLVHTVNLEDDVPGVTLGLSGLSASHSSQSSRAISPRSGGLDSPLLALGDRGQLGNHPDSMAGSPSLNLSSTVEDADTTVLQSLLEKEDEEVANASEANKTEISAKPKPNKPKDRKKQYQVFNQDGKRKYRCVACNKVFSGATIYRHLRTHDPDHRVTCKLCGKTYTQRTTLLMHMCKNHGYVPKPRPKKEGSNTSDEKTEEDSSPKKDDKKSPKVSKPSVSSSKKSAGVKSGQAVKSPTGAGKSANDAKRQRRASSQSPSNPLAPGLDQEERQIHRVTQMQVEEQRRVKAEQKQRKAAGEIPSASGENLVSGETNGRPQSSAVSSAENSTPNLGESGESSIGQQDGSTPDESATSQSNDRQDVTPAKSATAECHNIEMAGDLTSKQENEEENLKTTEASKEHMSVNRSNVAPESSSEASKTAQGIINTPQSDRPGKERQTSSLELDELISAVASGKAGDPPASLSTYSPPPQSDQTHEEEMAKVPQENIRKELDLSEDIFNPIIKKAEDGSDRFGCRLCTRTLASRNSFGLHVRRHKEEKTKVCIYCSKAFHTSQELKSHERTHTGEKPFKCDICFFSFSHFGSAHIHKKSHLARGETEPFPIVNGEIQYPASFKKPRTNSAERSKESSGSPKRKRPKKSSGDQSTPGGESEQRGIDSSGCQLLRRSSLDVNPDHQLGMPDAATANRRHSLNDQMLNNINTAGERSMNSFNSPLTASGQSQGGNTQHNQVPSSYSQSYSNTADGGFPGPNMAQRQAGVYDSPTGYPAASPQSQMGDTSQQLNPRYYDTNKLYTPTSSNVENPNVMSMQSPQEGYFSPQHQSPQLQQHQQQSYDYQPGPPSNVGYPQPIQHQQEPPRGYRPRLPGRIENSGGGNQVFKSNSPSTEIVKSLLQHYNLPETPHPGSDYSQQQQQQQQQVHQNYGHEGSPVAYSNQQESSGSLSYKDSNPPPYSASMGGQQQFYGSLQHQHQQAPAYPNAVMDRSRQFSPQQHMHQQPQQSPQHHIHQQPQQSPQHHIHQQPQQSPQHHMHQQPQQSPQHQAMTPNQQNLAGESGYLQQPGAPVESIQGSVYQQVQPGMSVVQSTHQKTHGIAASTPTAFSPSQIPQNLQPLPKISSLARDLPRSGPKAE